MHQPVSTRLDEGTTSRIDAYAEERGLSRSQALKELAEHALTLSGGSDAAEAKPLLEEALQHQEEIDRILAEANQRTRAQTQRLASTFESHIDHTDLDVELVEAFTDEPYVILPKAEDEAWVAVPRFVPFTVGWLDQQTPSYNVFVVNKYVNWIEELPTDIRDAVGIEARFDRAVVEDGVVGFADEAERDEAWDVLGGTDGGLYQREGERAIKIKRGKEFDVIASLVDEGNLPFKPRPIDEADLRDEPTGVELRPYQERAFDRFRETGMIGVFWPPGAGKTFLALYAGERVSGRKLVVVPNNTLKEQWRERINELCRYSREWDVETYQYFNHGNNLDEYQRKDIALTVYDEVHHLPANTFSKLATIGTEYRIGLSASPYREDQRTEYIFSLSGFPVGMNWDELKELGVVQRVPVKVYLYRTTRQKIDDVEALVGERTGKIVIFSDSLDRGEQLAGRLDAPFIYGETTDRMDLFRDNRVVVSSRVGDEGLSLEDIDVVINHDYHGGSRRQEIQRFGRVLHGTGDGEYIIQFTDEEFDRYSKRLFSLEERGFDIRLVRRE